MSHKGKIGIIILVILLVSSFSAAVIGFYFFQTEKIKVISISEELDNLRVQKRVAEEQLSRARIEIDELSAKYRTVQESIEELSVELEIAGAERGELESEIGILQSELQRQEDLKEQLKARHIQAEEEIIDLKILIHELQANEAGVEGGLKKTEATKEVALGKIVVESKGQEDQSAAAAVENLQTEVVAILEVKVLVINKDYDFVVINIGAHEGVIVGDVFSLYHEGNYIGDIKVERAQEAMSVCGVLSENIKELINEGDAVVLDRSIVKPGTKDEVSVLVRPSQSLAAAILEAKVLVINKDYDFAVINIGAHEGVIVGDVFSLYHEGNYIGDIKVERAQEAMSACVFLSDKVRNNIKESDKVVRK